LANERQGADVLLGHRHHWPHGRSLDTTLLLFDLDRVRLPE
jgi:hypothetical protein